ncbi:hypothetical protein ACS0TY_003069 [Phlomoides rotata]
MDAVSTPSECDQSTNSKFGKPNNLNAFDIISLSTGFDLFGLFVSNDQKDEVQFTSTKSASCVILKHEDVARELRFKVMKKDHGYMRLEGPVDSCRKETLSIDSCVSSPLLLPSYAQSATPMLASDQVLP